MYQRKGSESILDGYFGGKFPVIAPIGYGVVGEKYNINADWVAAQIAIALGAKKLIFLTAQNGILDAENQLVRRADTLLIDKMVADGTISGGMFTKVSAMIMAMNQGIKKVRVLNASHASQVLGIGSVGTLLTDVRSFNQNRMAGAINERAS